jgi:hypothetical protein
MLSSSTQRSLSARLDEEWTTIRTRPRLVARARAWGITDVAFESLDELLELAGYRVENTPERNDVLVRLVEIARTDELASRIVLQRVLPGLLAIVRRRRQPGGTHGSFEELIGAAWLAIRACRTDRRPERVAAAIVRDAAYRAFIAPVRRLSASEVSVDPRTLEETPYTVILSPCEELARLLGDAHTAGLPRRDLELLSALLRAGSPSTVAAERKVTTRTVRNHRDRATARVRRLALAA